MKKYFLIALLSLLSYSFADSINESNTNLKNSPTINSQYSSSSQQFGNQPVTGQKTEKFYTKQQLNNPQNNQDLNSQYSASSQQFGNQPLTGKKQQKYYTQKQLNNPQNSPNLNSRYSSSSQALPGNGS